MKKSKLSFTVAALVTVIALAAVIALVTAACSKDAADKARAFAESAADKATAFAESAADKAAAFAESAADAATSFADSAVESATSDKTANTAAVYYATQNLRLRSEPDTSTDNRIKSIPAGERVELLETGKTQTIDGISAPWFRVKTEDGTTGWAFSGFLSTTAPAGPQDYSKILKGDFSAFAGYWKDGHGDRQQLTSKGVFISPEAAGENIAAFGFKKVDGYYVWQNHTGEGGWAVILYPAGVDVQGYNGIISTDKTKPRIYAGQDGPSSNAGMYYKE